MKQLLCANKNTQIGMFEEDCVGQIIFTWFRTVHVILGFEERGVKACMIGVELPDGSIKFLTN